MSLRLNGSTSGYVEIDAPAVAGNNTLVFPSGNPATSGSFLVGSTTGALSFSTDPAFTAINGGQIAGTRNRLINGSMDVAQRGTSFAGQDGYALDRWYCNRNGGGAGVTFSQAYGAFSTKKNWMSVQRTAGNTSTQPAVAYQAIEGINCRDLAGQTVSFSFLLGSGSTLSSTSSNVTAVIAYQTGGTDIGPTGAWTSAVTTQFSVPSNSSPTRYSTQASIPSTATQIEVWITFAFSGTAGADDRYYVTDVQLENGSVATSFERRSFGAEVQLCQRYFEKSYPIDVAPGTNTGDANASIMNVAINGSDFYTYGTLRFQQTKRAIPTVTIYNPVTGQSGGFRGVSDATNNAATSTVGFVGHSGIGRVGAASANMTGTYVYAYHYTASAEL